MIPVQQTIFSGPRSNCYQACLASVLELPLADVPNVHLLGPDWVKEVCQFLRGRGLSILFVQHEESAPPPSGFSILTTEATHEQGRPHAVVCFDGQVVHDPLPGARGLIGARRYWTVFTAIRPDLVVELYGSKNRAGRNSPDPPGNIRGSIGS